MEREVERPPGADGVPGRASVVTEGTFVVLDAGDDKRVVCVKAKDRARVAKKWICLAPLLGHPFGTTFHITTHGDVVIDTERNVQSRAELQQGQERNNATLVDDGTSQALTAADIEALKREGGAEAVVRALTENSASFASKTEFSQEKYVKKKMRKHMVRVQVQRPTARTVAEAVFLEDPRRMAGLRVESLALVLALANVGAHARALVVDATGGVLTGAVLERMGGHGEVTAALVSRKGGVLGSVKAFNLPDASYTGLRSCMLADLLALMSSAAEGGDASANGKDEGRGEQGEGVEGPTGRGGGRAAEGRAILRATFAELKQRLARRFTAVVAAPLLVPGEVLTRLAPAACPGASFAACSPAAQELGEALTMLSSRRLATCMTLSETWFREQQVLPLRTHPHMMHSGTGGYVLSGQYVDAPGVRGGGAAGAPPSAAAPAEATGAGEASGAADGGHAHAGREAGEGDGGGEGEPQAKKARTN